VYIFYLFGMNPNFLLKDKLLYELCIRGISSDADVQTLHRLFRSVMLEGLSVDLTKVSSLGVEMYARDASNITELQNQVTQPKAGLSSLIPHFRTQISHLKGCLIHLTNLGLFPANITTSHYQVLHNQLDRIKQNITSLEMADWPGQEEKGEQDDMAQRPLRTHPNLLLVKVEDRLGVEDRGDTGDVSTVTVAVNNDTEALLTEVAQASTGINAATLPSLGQGASQVFTPHFYQRLPHLLSHLLKELPVVDSTDVNLLCDFLLKVLKIRQVGQMTDPNIYEIMYPYCCGDYWVL